MQRVLNEKHAECDIENRIKYFFYIKLVLTQIKNWKIKSMADMPLSVVEGRYHCDVNKV